MFEKVALLGRIDNLPKDLNFVVCGPSALSLRGGTTAHQPLWVAGDKETFPYSSTSVTYFYVPDVGTIPATTNLIGRYRCVTKEQAVIDMLKNISLPFDKQALSEYLWTLLSQKEDEEDPEDGEPYDVIPAKDKLRWIEREAEKLGILSLYKKELALAQDWRK
jgi:hypothetical protein